MSVTPTKIKPSSNPIPRTTARFLWAMVKKPSILIWFAIMFFAESVNVVAAFMFSFVARDIVHFATQNTQPGFAMFQPMLWTVAGILLTMALASYTSRFGWLKGRVPYEMNAKSFLYRATLGHSHTYFSNHHSGRIAEKIHQIPFHGVLIWDDLIMRIIPAVAVMVVASILLAALHPYLGLVVLLWTIGFVVLLRFFAPFHGRLSGVRARSKGVTMGAIVDSVSNNAIIRFFAQDEHEKATVQQVIDYEHETTRDLNANDRYLALCYTVPFMVLAMALLTLSVHLYSDGHILLPDLAFVITALLIMMQFLQWVTYGVVRVFEESSTIQEGLDLLAKSYDVVDAPDAKPLAIQKGAIDFDHVTFSYNDKGAVLNDLDLHIRAGEKIGLVGLSGAGKSTLVSLLLRFYDAQGQKISIDGQNIYDVTQHSLRKAIAVIPQDTALFHRTLMENIRYGREDASDEEVMEAARRAHAHEFIAELPDGYNTYVGERGVKLSGGQRQRIAIARAILKDAPILILDEATSALDSESERLIQDALEQLMEGKTVIAIAHRLSTIAHLDRLVVMEGGQIIEQGSHQNLLDQKGLYAKLWNMQSGGFL